MSILCLLISFVLIFKYFLNEMKMFLKEFEKYECSVIGVVCPGNAKWRETLRTLRHYHFNLILIITVNKMKQIVNGIKIIPICKPVKRSVQNLRYFNLPFIIITIMNMTLMFIYLNFLFFRLLQ